jgi:hypothetical protein
MANQKGNNAMYRKSLLLLVVSLLSAPLLSAHGNEKHVLGTVTAIAAGAISVETTSHQVQTVQITSETKFVRSGSRSSLNELKVGDRVVIHAKLAGDKLEATEVKSGPQPHGTTTK